MTEPNRRGHVTGVPTEDDHAPAGASLKIKFNKDAKKDYKSYGKKQTGKYNVTIPRLSYDTSNSSEQTEYDWGWTQNIPVDLHADWSTTYKARQSNEDEIVMHSGTTYKAKRAEVDAEIPATALHRDKEWLFKGMESRGELNPQSWGGARSHIKYSYDPNWGLIDPNATAFQMENRQTPTTAFDPLAFPKQQGGIRYKELSGQKQADLTDTMLNDWLQKTLKNPNG